MFESFAKVLQNKARVAEPCELSEADIDFVSNFQGNFGNMEIDTVRDILRIKDILANSKSYTTAIVYNKLEKLISQGLAFNIFRLERWPAGVICVYCGSDKILKLNCEIVYKNRFYCETCEQEFVDDDESPITNDDIKDAIIIWLTASTLDKTGLEFLGKKLNRTPEEIKKTLKELQDIFKSTEPLSQVSLEKISQLSKNNSLEEIFSKHNTRKRIGVSGTQLTI